MTPTWAVILVGLGSAVLGSLLATLLTISHERAAEFRARMLSAADEFSTGASAALQQARFAAGEVLKDRNIPLVDGESFRPEIQAHFDKANGAVDDVLAKQARIHLLFGDQSPAGIAATGVGSQLGLLLGALEHRPDSIRDHDELIRYSRNREATLEQHEQFNREARAAIRQTWWDRFRGWASRWFYAN